MPLNMPAFFRPRHSFHRLRSLHLSPAEARAKLEALSPKHEKKESILPVTIVPQEPPTKTHFSRLVAPVPGSSAVILSICASLIFIAAICFAFLGGDVDDSYFQESLSTIAQTNPGLVFVGQNVDVDIDEPSITVRWTIVSCGEDVMLPGSQGAFGSKTCGLPLEPFQVFVDGDDNPTAIYDPTDIPFNKESGHRRNIENIIQFDSDHVLDVHEARLYPFDNYFLSSTLRAATLSNESIPLSRVLTLSVTSSFDVDTQDLESFTKTENGTQYSSRDFDMYISRPNSSRFFTLGLFAVSWGLTHITIAHVILARRNAGLKPLLWHMASTGAILIAIPQIRNSMPDAPGLDGVLIDCIGFFPQMTIVGICVVCLLLILAVRELDLLNQGPAHSREASMYQPHYGHPRRVFDRRNNGPSRSSIIARFPRPPPMPNLDSSPADLAEWEKHRVRKQLQGEYVFPPVSPVTPVSPFGPIQETPPLRTSLKPPHRRVQTMSKIMEELESSKWSDDDD